MSTEPTAKQNDPAQRDGLPQLIEALKNVDEKAPEAAFNKTIFPIIPAAGLRETTKRPRTATASEAERRYPVRYTVERVELR
jgi:hypothetical protein